MDSPPWPKGFPCYDSCHSSDISNESSEFSGSDEIYALVTVAGLRPLVSVPGGPSVPGLPDFHVQSYGVFENMNDDDPEPVIVNGKPFWGIDGLAQDVIDPADVAIVVSVMENDNGTPAQYVELVNVKTSLSLAASLGDPDPRSRAIRLTDDITNVLNAIDVPIPFAFDDDHIGTQQFVLDQSDLLTSGHKDRTIVIGNDDAELELVIRIRFFGWEHTVPGDARGALPVAQGTSPTSWFTTPDNVQHIGYVGADDKSGLLKIHELFFRVGVDTGWTHTVPGDARGAIPVAQGTSPTSWFTTPDNVQHIGYVGTNNLIHELFFRIS